MTSNFLKHCTGSADRIALAVGVSGVESAAGASKMCIGSGEGVAGSE